MGTVGDYFINYNVYIGPRIGPLYENIFIKCGQCGLIDHLTVTNIGKLDNLVERDIYNNRLIVSRSI